MLVAPVGAGGRATALGHAGWHSTGETRGEVTNLQERGGSGTGRGFASGRGEEMRRGKGFAGSGMGGARARAHKGGQPPCVSPVQLLQDKFVAGALLCAGRILRDGQGCFIPVRPKPSYCVRRKRY